MLAEGFGDFKVVWSDQQDVISGIWARRYYSDGTSNGDAFLLTDTFGPDHEGEMSIAGNGQGRLVIARKHWDNDGAGIFAQVYEPDGMPDGDEFQVNIDSGGSQILPVVAWSYYGAASTLTLTFADVAAGAYKLTLFSGPGGLEDLAGNALDGDEDGNAGKNYELDFVVAMPGDTNLDGTVDLDDLFALRNNLGITQSADADADLLAAVTPMKLESLVA